MAGPACYGEAWSGRSAFGDIVATRLWVWLAAGSGRDSCRTRYRMEEIVMRRSLIVASTVLALGLGLAGPAWADNPPGPPGPPSQSCQDLEPNTPGNAANSPRLTVQRARHQQPERRHRRPKLLAEVAVRRGLLPAGPAQPRLSQRTQVS